LTLVKYSAFLKISGQYPRNYIR